MNRREFIAGVAAALCAAPLAAEACKTEPVRAFRPHWEMGIAKEDIPASQEFMRWGVVERIGGGKPFVAGNPFTEDIPAGSSVVATKRDGRFYIFMASAK